MGAFGQELDGELSGPIAGKPAPTRFCVNRNYVTGTKTVGAGLPAMGPVVST
jgi:hypothetical protein